MQLNDEVTRFLAGLNHPLKKEIDFLRQIILTANSKLGENIKWNSPNYHVNNADRITMRVQPPGQIQLIFHRGAKVLDQPKLKLIKDDSGLLVWKSNDRAVASFKNMEAIQENQSALTKIVKVWIAAAE
jgi:hypothetical protein